MMMTMISMKQAYYHQLRGKDRGSADSTVNPGQSGKGS